MKSNVLNIIVHLDPTSNSMEYLLNQVNPSLFQLPGKFLLLSLYLVKYSKRKLKTHLKASLKYMCFIKRFSMLNLTFLLKRHVMILKEGYYIIRISKEATV